MAITNNLTNSSLRKFLPSKVVSGLGSDLTGLESWLYDDGSNDPWWQGAAGTPVKWILTATVTPTTHSSHLTRAPNLYDGLDIEPGMWVFSASDPKAVRIVSVISQTDSAIQCIVEDVDRYNTFTDPTSSGVGIFSPTDNLIFFELGDDGLPILNPLPANTDISVVSQVEARFRVFNPTVETRFFQINHGFKEGQVVKLDAVTGLFLQATSNDIYYAGTVTAIGPGPNYFYLSPSTKIIEDLEPGIPGDVGDIIWIDPTTGDRTTVPNGSNAALYIKMTDEVKSFATGSVDNPTTFDGTSIKLNNDLITFSGSTIDIQAIIDTINIDTSNHGVVASLGSAPTIVIGSVAYSMTTPSTVLAFTLNDIAIECQLPSVNFGTAGQLGWWDVIRSVNEQTHLHGVYATFDSFTGFVNFQNAFGGPINFTNVTPATTSGADQTLTDMLGVAASNPSAAPSRLQLVRADGGSIIASDITGTFSYDTGILSSNNGSLPLALVVDKTMSTNSNYMVADLAARDALSGLRAGDQVYVQSDLDGEWALYVKVASGWTKIANADSASTDAKSLQTEVDFSSTSPIIIGNISQGTRVVDVSVTISTAFNGSAPTMTIGTSTVVNAIIDTNIVDLTTVGTYESNCSFVYDGTDGTDMDVYVYFNTTGSTTGQATVIVSYL